MERDRPTMPVPLAGKKYFGLSRNGSYAAAARGDIPTIKIGSRIYAVVAALERMIERTALPEANPSSPPQQESADKKVRLNRR